MGQGRIAIGVKNGLKYIAVIELRHDEKGNYGVTTAHPMSERGIKSLGEPLFERRPPSSLSQPEQSATLTASHQTKALQGESWRLGQSDSSTSTIPHPTEPVKSENEATHDQTRKDITDEQKRILGDNTKTEFVEGDVRKAHTPEEDEAALKKHGLTPDTLSDAVAVGSHKFDKDNLVHSIKLSLMSPEEMRTTSLHEIGHGIQKTLDAMGRTNDMEILEMAHAKEAKANGEAVSETIADKFRDYVLGKENAEPKGLVRRIFDRIIEFAVRAITELIKHAVLAETRPDRDNNADFKNIHIFNMLR